jgi:AcrR family transcriptional regulator
LNSVGKPHGRPRRFDRDAVLDTATGLFARHGYGGTSLSELVQAIGCTPPSLYNLFHSKEELYLAVLNRYWARANSTTRTKGRAWTLLEEYLQASLARFAKARGPRGCLVLTGGFRESAEEQELVEDVRKKRRVALNTLTRLVRKAQEEGDLPRELDAPTWARALFALLQGLALQSMDGATLKDLKGGLSCFLSKYQRQEHSSGME